MTKRARRTLVAMGVVTLSMSMTSPGFTAVGSRRLPPSDRDKLAEIFDPMLSDLGFRTTRARLQNLETYEEDPRGRHLALYAEPMSPGFSDADYVSSLTDLADVYLPLVFRRWKGLKSFDVCLESPDDPRAEPPAIVQVVATRRGARQVDWSEVTLVELLAIAEEYANDPSPRDVFVYFDSRLDEQPALKLARAAASAESRREEG